MEIEQFCNQTATLERIIPESEDEWSTPAFEDPITIKVRTTIKHKLNKKTRHDSYISVTQHMTPTQVALGDRINGEEILAVDTIVDFDGTTLGYKAHPRPPVGFAN